MDHFWHHLTQLLDTSRVVIDRPAGSQHPRYPDLVYPLAYGYLEGTTAADGAGIDVWVGSLQGQALVGIVCTVDLMKRDTEIKLLLGCNSAEVQTIVAFHNGDSQAAVAVLRDEARPH